MRAGAVALAAMLTLAGCGPPLGTYDVIGLTVADDLPQSYRHSRLPEPYLRIEVTSDFDLVAEGNGNIYPFKIGCGFLGDEERMIFGPFVAEEPVRSLYMAEPVMPRDNAGKAHYLLFLPVSAAADRPYANAETIEPPYDLRTDEGDLCIKITQSGYFLTESASRTIRISSEEIADTLAALPGQT